MSTKEYLVIYAHIGPTFIYSFIHCSLFYFVINGTYFVHWHLWRVRNVKTLGFYPYKIHSLLGRTYHKLEKKIANCVRCSEGNKNPFDLRTWVHLSSLPFTKCVTLGKLFSCPLPPFPHRKDGGNRSAASQGCPEDWMN